MIIGFYSSLLILLLSYYLPFMAPIMCWCAVKKLLTHSYDFIKFSTENGDVAFYARTEKNAWSKTRYTSFPTTLVVQIKQFFGCVCVLILNRVATLPCEIFRTF